MTKNRFKCGLSKDHQEVQRAVSGVLLVDKLEFPAYSGKRSRETPGYVLPVEFSGRQLVGFVALPTRTHETAIGFKRQGFPRGVDYFRMTSRGETLSLVSCEKRKDPQSPLYLPLRLTGLRLEEKCDELYGLGSTTHKYPIFLAFESEEGLRVCGFYKDNRRRLRMFETIDHNELVLEEALKNFHLNRQPKAKKKTTKRTVRKATRKSTAQSTTKKPKEKPKKVAFVHPRNTVSFLDDFVIGQEYAKRQLAVAFTTYVQRASTNERRIPIQHALLMGNSGVGKTLIAQRLAEEAGLPFSVTSLTGKSAAGYQGEDLSDAIKKFRASKGSNRPYGVLFVDEMDKGSASIGADDNSFGPRLQDELIGWLSGNGGKVEGVDMSNLLFVGAGAFQGTRGHGSLQEIIARRTGQASIGFQHAGDVDHISEADAFEILQQVQPEDLVEYGLKTELTGRLKLLVPFHDLTKEQKAEILQNQNNMFLNGHLATLESMGYEVRVDLEIPSWIAERTPRETGARGLEQVCNALCNELIFDADKHAEEGIIQLTVPLAEELSKRTIRAAQK